MAANTPGEPVDYRLSTEAVFPAQIHDVKAAIRWFRANAGMYGIDGARIGLWGYSAGAQLAALAGLTSDVPGLDGDSGSPGHSSRVQAVVLASMLSDFLRPGGLNHIDHEGPVTWLFGGTADAHGEAMCYASPISHVHRNAPPFLIAHGTEDETVPFEQSRLFHQALVTSGVDSTLVPIHGGLPQLDDEV